MCIFPIMYSEINILMLNVNFVQDSRCILHNGKYDFAGDRAWNCFEYSSRATKHLKRMVNISNKLVENSPGIWYNNSNHNHV